MSATSSASPAEPLGPMIVSAHTPTQPIRVVVVGAGGTGGRLIPPLMQVLRNHDTVAIVDGDHVEDRNLARQNFRPRDVGENKAEVMVRRYRREGIQTDAYATMLEKANIAEITRGRGTPARVVILGCVDNWKARQEMQGALAGIESLWIDGGNERRGGQVILSTYHWPMKVTGPHPAKYGELHTTSANWHIRGMSAMPQLLASQPWHCDRCNVDNKPEAAVCKTCKQPEASCRDRIDLQTVAVNQLSATCILNILSCVLYQVPMTACGAFFSTLNTMSPIRLKTVRWDQREILPETTYADTGKPK